SDTESRDTLQPQSLWLICILTRDFHPTGPPGVNPASTATQCPLRLRWMHSSSADDCMPPCHCGRYGCAVTNSIRMFLPRIVVAAAAAGCPTQPSFGWVG